MSIIIDSLRPTDACSARPTSNDTCEIEATFHTVTTSPENQTQAQEMWDQDRIFIHRLLRGQQVQYVLDDTRVALTVRPILRDHHFDLDLARADIQAALDRSGVLVRYVQGQIQEYRRNHPDLPESAARFMESIGDFALVGNIENPDSLQRDRNRQLYRQLAELPNDLHRFVRMNLLTILAGESGSANQTNRSRWSGPMNSRFDRLIEISNLSDRLRQQTARFGSSAELSARLLQFVGQWADYVFEGQPSLDELTRSLRNLAMDLYRAEANVSPTRTGDDINLYRLLDLDLEPLRQRPSFHGTGAVQDRFERFFHWVRIPEQSENLEFSVLSPSEALEQSFYRQVSNPSMLQALVRGVNDVMGPPFLTSDWLSSHGNLREMIHAITISLRVEGASENPTVRLDLTQLNQNLQTLFSEHGRDRREFIAGSLAVLRFFFGSQGNHQGLRAFWNGSFRELPFHGDFDRIAVRALYQSLTRQIQGSPNVTERVLPITEGVLCALGIVGMAADSVRMGVSGGSDLLDNAFLGATGFMTGLGCTPLLGRAVAGAPRNAWLRDGLLGGAGALGLGSAGFLIPFAFRPGMTPPDPGGRGPSMGFGP
jgi:hypothetical protein